MSISAVVTVEYARTGSERIRRERFCGRCGNLVGIFSQECISCGAELDRQTGDMYAGVKARD